MVCPTLLELTAASLCIGPFQAYLLSINLSWSPERLNALHFKVEKTMKTVVCARGDYRLATPSPARIDLLENGTE